MLTAQEVLKIFQATGDRSMHQHALLAMLQAAHPDSVAEDLRNSLIAAEAENVIAIGRDGFVRLV